jgi:hypothetical protein
MVYECQQSKTHPDEYVVEAIDYASEGEITPLCFSGPGAKARAVEYAAWKNWQSSGELHMFDVYGGEEEVVIAKDEGDARVIMLTMSSAEELEDAPFHEYDDDAEYTRRDENDVPVTKTVREWCKQEGRGYFRVLLRVRMR